MPAAARITDMHSCPMVSGGVPHVGGALIPPGCVSVLIDGLPAARVSDIAICNVQVDTIARGSSNVFIGGLPAARVGDPTAHGGMIVSGSPDVMIGG